MEPGLVSFEQPLPFSIGLALSNLPSPSPNCRTRPSAKAPFYVCSQRLSAYAVLLPRGPSRRHKDVEIPTGTHGLHLANVECPDCKGTDQVDQHGGLRQKTLLAGAGRRWIKSPPTGR